MEAFFLDYEIKPLLLKQYNCKVASDHHNCLWWDVAFWQIFWLLPIFPRYLFSPKNFGEISSSCFLNVFFFVKPMGMIQLFSRTVLDKLSWRENQLWRLLLLFSYSQLTQRGHARAPRFIKIAGATKGALIETTIQEPWYCGVHWCRAGVQCSAL